MAGTNKTHYINITGTKSVRYMSEICYPSIKKYIILLRIIYAILQNYGLFDLTHLNASWHHSISGFFLLFLRLKLPTRHLGCMWLEDPCRIRFPFPQDALRSAESWNRHDNILYHWISIEWLLFFRSILLRSVQNQYFANCRSATLTIDTIRYGMWHISDSCICVGRILWFIRNESNGQNGTLSRVWKNGLAVFKVARLKRTKICQAFSTVYTHKITQFSPPSLTVWCLLHFEFCQTNLYEVRPARREERAGATLTLSVGECSEHILKLDMDEDRLRLDAIPRLLGYGLWMSRSSPGRHISTMASRQFTNNSALSWFWAVCIISRTWIIKIKCKAKS